MKIRIETLLNEVLGEVDSQDEPKVGDRIFINGDRYDVTSVRTEYEVNHALPILSRLAVVARVSKYEPNKTLMPIADLVVGTDAEGNEIKTTVQCKL